MGILGAAAAGVVIGLLVAPEKGTEMRKRITKKAGNLADSMSHLWSNGKHAAETALADVKDKAGKANKVKETFS